MNPKLLIVDDDEDIRTQMKWALSKEYEILLAEDRAGAVSAFTASRPAVVMLDLGLPPRPNAPDEGLAALSELLASHPHADRQHLRQLARNAHQERLKNKPPHAYRELFRELRELTAQGEAGADDAADDTFDEGDEEHA